MADRLLVDMAAGGRVSVWQALDNEVPSPIGEPVALQYPLSAEELEELRWYVEDYLRAPFAVYEQRGAEIAARLPEWGQRLFSSVFGTGPARDAYVGVRNRAAASVNTPIGGRPEIVFRSPAAAWLGLPWELARDAGDASPIGLGGVEVVRSLPAGMDPAFQVLGERLRVLMVISRPRGAGDVGYRMIARPLLDRLAAVSGQVELVVLRPPTLQALVDTLAEARAAGAPFQVVHFDGHGALAGRTAGAGAPLAYGSAGGQGILVFEKPGGGAEHVPADHIAGVLAEARVPVVVLNACQSGAIGKDLEATVATRLLAGGASSVVAMAYSVYAVAAAEFMTAFYERLFSGEPVSAAVAAGRARLARNPLRPSPKGELPLEDWLVPVHYLRREVRFPQLRTTAAPRGEVSLNDYLDRARSAEPSAQVQPADPWAPRDRFVGRDGLFYDLEVATRLQKMVLLHGSAGVGKTELAKAFGRWWRATGGVDNPEWVIWHSFQPGLATFGLDGVLSTIGLQVFGADFARVPADQRREVILRLLAEYRLLVVWDNFESVHSMPDPTAATPALDEAGRRELIDFLTAVAAPGGRSAILITSRSPEPWLRQDLRRIPIGGLSTEEANEYAKELLKPFPAARAKRGQRAFGELMQWLEGHPLSMRLTLPQLASTDPATLLRQLQGLTPLPGDEEGDRLTSLPASITYSITHLDEPTRRRLAAVSLFHGVADADVLGVFSQSPDVPAQFRDVNAEDWTGVLDRAAGVGLLTPLGSRMYGLHPALPAYLAAQWRTENPGGYDQQREAATTALLNAHATFGAWLTRQIDSGDAGGAYALIDRQRRTLGQLLGHALDTGQWQQAQAIAEPVNDYLGVSGLATEADAWVDRARLALETADGSPPALDDPAGALWLFLVGAQANRQLNAGQLDAAEQTYRRILDMLTAQPESAERQRRLGVSYHQLGRVTQDRGRLEQAEEWYRRSLTIKEDLGDRRGQATSYHQLGRVAQDRGRLDEAEDWYRRSLTINEQLGNRPSQAISYHQLGMLAQARGRLDEAEDWYRRSLTIKEDLGARPGLASTYGQLGLLAERRQHGEEALEWMVRCVALFDQFPHPATGPGPDHLARLTAALGVEELQRSWLRVTGQALPPAVLAYVESH